MAASPVFSVPPELSSRPPSRRKRHPYALTPRRLAANRRNAECSTGPRTNAGKARVARNAVKHGIFADATRWRPEQHRDYVRTLDGLREDFNPHNARESGLVATVADSYVRIAALLRYENFAALKYHQQCECELDQRIAAATPAEAARLEAYREELRAAGLWGPTLPGPGEAMAILRYEGRLDRTIYAALRELDAGKKSSICAGEAAAEIAKTNPLRASRATVPSAARRTSGTEVATDEIVKTNPFASRASDITNGESEKTNPLRAAALAFETGKNEKTNPLDAGFVGNRHQRRRAEALARREAKRS